jgi:acylpyruvate hydrolase
MRFVFFESNDGRGLAAERVIGSYCGLLNSDPKYPGDLDKLIGLGHEALEQAHRTLLEGDEIDSETIRYLPPFLKPGKIICIGLNYVDHSIESGFEQPSYPTLFARFTSSIVGHKRPLIRPAVSEQLDYEGEIAAIIGRKGRHITKSEALEYVAGYSVFNEGSVREYQFKAPQWTMGKNFDETAGFGPSFVTADELPPGCRGLRLRTRLNGKVMQDTSTDDMVFDVASIISIVSEAITLDPGDVIVTGTPPGIGFARKPPVFMKAGDVCEVEVDGLGTLVNPVLNETIPN